VARKNKQDIITSYRILYRIQIGLNIIDRPILDLINNNLNNIGKIYDYPTRQESTMCFISLESLKNLIDTVFSKYPLLTEYQANRYAILKAGVLGKKTSVKTIEEFNSFVDTVKDSYLNKGNQELSLAKVNKFESLSKFYLDYWLVGFLNGEVSFTSFKGKNGNLKPKVSLEHTDEKALIFFKSHLNLGPKVIQLKQREERKITYRIDITSVTDINYITQFLDQTDCLLGNKFIQYSTWKSKYNL